MANHPYDKPVLGRERGSIAGKPNHDEHSKSLFLEAYQFSGLVGPAMREVNARIKGPKLTYQRVARWREEDPVFHERLCWFEDQLKLDLENLAVSLAFGKAPDPETGEPGTEPDAVMVRWLLPRLYPEKYSEKRQIALSAGPDNTPFLPEIARPQIIDVIVEEEDPDG